MSQSVRFPGQALASVYEGVRAPSMLRSALVGVGVAVLVLLLGDLFLRTMAVDARLVEPHEICLEGREGCVVGGRLLTSGYDDRPFEAVLRFPAPLPPERVLLLRPSFVDRVELLRR